MSLIKIDWNPPPRTLRSFGIICLVAFPLLGLMAHFQVMAFAALPDSAKMTVALVLAGLGVLCGLLALAAPIALKPLFIGMSIIALPIGFVISNTLLILLYYLVVTPIALIFRLIGRDALHRRPDRDATTYWVPRTPPASLKRYFRQF
ncbi:MAG TPA: hypothetical protein P5081_06960 [Phycisphaerae bacterium]|nr:hypothetical protein [Phycisphaerae bacterium]HRW52612.1 hypothetical protein [Phycisphaerae bacterium]